MLLVNILFYIFNNAQLTVILSFVNKKYKGNEVLINSIGTVSTIMNILIYPFILGLSSSMEILGSQSFGANKFYLFGCFINKTKIIGYSYVILQSFIIYFFHNNIFDIWKLEENIRVEAYKIIILRIISVFFEYDSLIKLRYIQIINKSKDALFIITLNGLLLPVFSYVFIVYFDLLGHGCGLVYLCNNFSLLITLTIYINLCVFDEKINIPFNKDSFSEYYSLLQVIVPLSLISLMDNLNAESMSILANYFDTKSYSEFMNAYSLYNLIGTISIAFNTATSIIIASFIGKESAQTINKIFKNIIFIGILIAIIFGITNYILSDLILSLVIQSDLVEPITKNMFYISIICNMIDIIIAILLSTLKSLGYIYSSFTVYFFGNIMNFLMIYTFAFNTEMKIYGIFFGYLINEVFAVFMYILMFVLYVDFEKSYNEIKSNLNQIELKTL